MKQLTEGHRQEWSLRLNSIHLEKNHQIQTWHLVVCFLSRNVHPYSFLCGPVLLSARVACHQGRHALGGKRGLERPVLGVAVTALAGGEFTVGDEFWARHWENGVTSDAKWTKREGNPLPNMKR